MWEEVRRLNTELGMTIFLTTQYLEEADELADRVGIIDEGKLVAEGTPTALKRRSATTSSSSGSRATPRRRARPCSRLDGVVGVEVHGDELTVSAADGAAAISPVAVALSGCDVAVRELTLRTPTLDDVFLELTGNRIQSTDAGDLVRRGGRP